jgi:hypothetical protein
VRCEGLQTKTLTATLSGKKRATSKGTLLAQFPTDTKLSCDRAVTRRSSSSAMLAVQQQQPAARGSSSSRAPPARSSKDYSNKSAKKATGGSSGSAAARAAAKGAAKKRKPPAPVHSNFLSYIWRANFVCSLQVSIVVLAVVVCSAVAY